MKREQSVVRNQIQGVLLAIGIALFYLVACKSSTNNLSLTGTAGTPTPTPTATPSPTPLGNVPSPVWSGSTLVTVTADLPTTVYSVLHQSTDWTKSCAIDVNSSLLSDKDITCYLDIEELDLYANSFTLNVSSPFGACPYMEINPYYFMSHQPGIGPTYVTYTQDGSTGVISGLTSSDNTKLTLTSGSTDLVCNFDYTSGVPLGSQTNQGPNCCQGKYTANITTLNGTLSTSSSVKKDWGGKSGNCAAGPRATDSQFKRDPVTGLPKRIISALYAGGSFKVNIDNAMNSNYLSNVYSANYVLNTGSTPAALSTGPSQLYYEWDCLDGAFEVLGRIRLLIREWNLASELAKGASGNPDSSGNETDYPTLPKNDLNDWDDFINSSVSYPEYRL